MTEGLFRFTCTHCGREGLRLQYGRGRYRLFDQIDREHDCAEGKKARRRWYLQQHPGIAQAARMRREGKARLARDAS